MASVDGHLSLVALGWRPFFQQQLTLDELETTTPVRVIEQHRSRIVVAGDASQLDIELHHDMPDLVVGDWILLDDRGRFVRLLERSTCFRRKAAGSRVEWQLIAANVDTAFIVCSLNEDFNLNRIERYMALVNEAGATPVVVLSKSDLTETPEEFLSQVRALDGQLAVEAVNCLNSDSVDRLRQWVREGDTVAVLGSSGVGKSTLINTLSGSDAQATAGIREDDAKGRHTTTRRSLLSIPTGGLILDTPGMRELQLADSQEGIEATFADIEALALRCRFTDCQHESEPGCAVREAVASGELADRRLENYSKLRREEALNSASLSEKRAADKALGKFYKRTQTESRKLRGR